MAQLSQASLRVALGGVLVLVLAACAELPKPTTAMLTYDTSPSGASIFEGGKLLGVAPVTRTYSGDGKSPTIQTPDVTAVWPSGAKANFFTVIPVGSDRAATIERPASAPNLALDLENAKKADAEKLRLEQKAKEDVARAVARDSARCRNQMRQAIVVNDDCS